MASAKLVVLTPSKVKKIVKALAGVLHANKPLRPLKPKLRQVELKNLSR